MPYVALDRTLAEAAPTTNIGVPVPLNGMSLLDFDNELNALLIGRTDVGPVRRRLWTNMAYVDLVTSLRLAELKDSIEIPLVAGAFMYRLPPVVRAIIGVSMIDDDEDPTYGGKPLEMSDLLSFRGRPLLSSRPQQFFRHSSDLLVVWPTPEVDGSLVVDFWVRPVWMTADAHCPILFVEWHEAVLLAAKHKALHSLQEWEASMAANNDFTQFVRRRIATETLEEETKVMRSSVPRSDAQLRHRRGDPRWRHNG